MSSFVRFIFIITISCQRMHSQNLSIPKNYSVIDSIKGDLDRDGIDEFVVAYNTEIEKDDYESVPRELVIYKKSKDEWKVWEKSGQALYGSRDGGMMGDPFGQIEIKNGLLLVSQDGGSSWKWGHTDKYRFQDEEFYLIGYISHYGKLCEYWESVDFNLNTGKMIIEKEYESCENGDEQKVYKRENETMYKKGIKIIFEKRNEKEILIISPKYKHEIYISTTAE